MNVKDGSVILRAPEIEDAEFLRGLMNSAGTEYTTTNTNMPVAKHDQIKWIESQHDAKDIHWVVEAAGQPIGMVSAYDIDYVNRTVGFSVKFAAVLSRSRAATMHALVMFADFLFNEMNMECLHTVILDYNTPSIKLVEKFGFTREGVLRNRYFKHGEYHDAFPYSLLRSEWAPIKERLSQKVKRFEQLEQRKSS